jgi:hypothetical protein
MDEYKITPESFINEIVEAYKQARKAKVDNARITRGRSHSISSYVEDLFANFLAENLGKYEFFIDQPVSVKGRRNAIYPDVAIVSDGKIVNLVDLKMDLGWNRKGFIQFCKDKETLITDIRGKSCKIKDGITKKSRDLEIDSNLKYHVVIVNDGNITKEQMKQNIEGTKGLDNVCVYLLSAEQHPNTYEEEKLKNIKIKTDQFDKLMNNLK